MTLPEISSVQLLAARQEKHCELAVSKRMIQQGEVLSRG